MATRTDLSVLLLMIAHSMVSLSTGGTAFEKNPPQRNSSENESTGIANNVSTHVNSNATSALPSVAATLLKEEQKLEDELVRVLNNVRSSGQTLIVISSTGVENSTKQIVEPLVIIEGSTTTVAPSLDPTGGTIFDQEISQTRSRSRSSPREEADGERVDDIDRILAVAEYEPRKIGARENQDKTGAATRLDGPNLEDGSSMVDRLSKGDRYDDVIGQRNLPTSSQRRADYGTEKTSSRRLNLGASDSPSLPNERTRTRQISFPAPTVGDKSILYPRVERSREPRHSQYSPLSRHGELVWRLPENLEGHSGHSTINDSDAHDITASDKLHNLPIVVSETPSPPIFREIGQKRVSFDGEKTRRPAITIGDTRQAPRMADKRIDDYSKASEHQKYKVPDARLDNSLNRYNSPSVIPSTSASVPAAATRGRNIILAEDDEPDYAAESRDRSASKSDDSAYDYYQDYSEEKSPIGQSASSNEDGKEIRVRGAIATARHPRGNEVRTKVSNSYGNVVESIPITWTPVYESYEDYGVTDEPKSLQRQRSLYSTVKQPQSLPINPNGDTGVDLPTRPTHRRPLAYPADEPYDINHLGPSPFSLRNVYTDDKRPRAKAQQQVPPSKHSVIPGVPYDSRRKTEDATPNLSAIDKLTDNSVDDKYHRFVNLRALSSILAEEKNNDRLYLEKNSSRRSSPGPRLIHVRPTSGPSVEIATSANSLTDTNGNRPVDAYSLAVARRASQAPRTSDDERPARLDETLRPRSTSWTFRAAAAAATTADSPVDRNYERRIISAESNEEPADVVREAEDEQEDEQVAASGDETPSRENHETRQRSKKEEAEDEESEKGGGEKHSEGHRAEEGEKAEEGYKKWHEYDKGKKGHSDSEHHENEYDESKGGEKKHHDSSGYHEEHSHGEKASKESEFGEKGEHSKGHSTKGQHVVHKNDEYEKKTEFYDESHEEDGDEKEGEYSYDREEEKGAREKIGHHDSGYEVDGYGKKAEHEKGRHWDETEGHDEKDGSESEHSHEEKYGKKSAHEEGEEWSRQDGDKETR